MQQRHAYSSLIVIILAIWSMKPAVAQERGPLWGLAEVLCKQGKEMKSPTIAKQFSLEPEIRLFQEFPNRLVAVQSKQCLGGQSSTAISFSIVIQRILLDTGNHTEGYVFLTSNRGDVIRVLRVIGDPGDVKYLSVTVTDQIAIVFEAEKKYWLTKYGLPVR